MNMSRYPGMLAQGQFIEFRPRGHSMNPTIRSGQLVRLEPSVRADLKVDDVVLARVSGQLYLHRISAMTQDRVQISNARGQVNGWTTKDRVYGIVTIIYY